jgi:hypothetical protein
MTKGDPEMTETTLLTDQPTEWLTEPELRQRLRFSKSTLRRLRQRGLPCVGAGRLRRYCLATVLKWLSERA